MNNLIRLIIATGLLTISLLSNAQDKPGFKFGKVSVSDFNVQVPNYDSGAHAIIIGDIGRSAVIPNDKGGFGYEFERRLRIKIIDINGIDAGKFEIPIYSAKNSSAKEELRSVKAITYNLEGGKVIEAKLENNQVFTENTSKYLQLKKFSLPALKAGSIFEISYRISSDFIFNFKPWTFQHQYPCLWSEYETEIPEYYNYVTLSQGYIPYTIKTNSSATRSFRISKNRTSESISENTFTINGLVQINRWVIKEVPSIKEENFTTSLENHIAKIEFQLSSIKYPDQPVQMVMESWQKVTKDFMEDEDFGAQLDKNNNWLDDDISRIIGNSKEPLEKTKKLYAYLRDNFTCTRAYGLYISTGLKNLLKTKSGSVADINLLLIAMLKHEKIECYPIILSTRSHGITHPIYPLLDRFNYVTCVALIGEGEYFLDASVPDLAFGKMKLNSYNGHARVLTADPIPFMLSADSIVEKSLTMAFLNVEKNVIKGKVISNHGYYESLDDRAYLKEKGKDAFFEKIKTSYGTDYEISDTGIDSLKQLDNPIAVYYEIALKENTEDVLYFNPVLVPFYKENPFTAAVRRYPVEMPCKIDETFMLRMQLPDGYVVDELPKSTKVKFNDDEGIFEYVVSSSDGIIQLRTRISLAKANFPPEDYEGLRDFFSYVIKKQAEQIVFKKKSN